MSFSRNSAGVQNLILFADSLIDAPTYGVFHFPGHQYDGLVFDTSMGYLSATTFGDWITAFVDRGEEGLLSQKHQEPEQVVPPND